MGLELIGTTPNVHGRGLVQAKGNGCHIEPLNPMEQVLSMGQVLCIHSLKACYANPSPTMHLYWHMILYISTLSSRISFRIRTGMKRHMPSTSMAIQSTWGGHDNRGRHEKTTWAKRLPSLIFGHVRHETSPEGSKYIYRSA